MIDDAFFNVFGIECFYNNFIFKGILDAESQVFNTGQIGIRSTLYKLTVKTNDCKQMGLVNNFGDAVDKSIYIKDEIYKIQDGGIQEDGEICILILNKE